MLYGVVLPLAPLALLLSTPEGSGAAAIATTLTMAALFPVYYNVLSQFVNRRDELVLKRLRTGETSDAELLASIALPGVVLALAVMLVAVPVAVALGEPVPLNPVVYAVTGLVTMVLFSAFAFWTAAWTRNAEAAQLTSGPVILLAVFGQMSVAFPERVQRWVDLTPGAAMTDLVRVGMVRVRRARDRAHPRLRRHLGGGRPAAAGAGRLDGDRGLARRAVDALGAPHLRGWPG